MRALAARLNALVLGRVEPTLARKLTRGIFWTFTGTLVFRGLVLLSTIVIARLLGKEGFGAFGIVRSTVDMFIAFAGFGLAMTATKGVMAFKVEDKTRAGRVIGLSLFTACCTGGLMALVLLVSADYLAGASLHAPDLALALKCGAVAIFLYSVNAAQNGILSGFEAFRLLAANNCIAGLLHLPIALVLVHYFDVLGAVMSVAANAAISVGLGAVGVWRAARAHGVNVAEKRWLSENKVLLQISLPAALSGAVVLPITWLCNAVLVRQPGGYEAMGIYNAAMGLFLIIGAVNNMLGEAFFPYAIENAQQKSHQFEVINNVLPWGIGIALALPLMLLPEAGSIVFGAEFVGESLRNTIAITMLSAIVVAHRQGIARSFAVRNYLWYSVLGNCFWGLVAVGSMHWLKDYGAEGRAAAFVVAYALNTVVFLPFYMRRGLCERAYLVSKPSIAIWAIIVLAFIGVVCVSIPVYLRVVLLMAILGVVAKLLFLSAEAHSAGHSAVAS